jgi:hypothetical protein
MKKFSVRSKDDCDDQAVKSENKINENLTKLMRKLFWIISKEYDDNNSIKFSSIQDIQFYIDFKAPVSIEILLQKYFAEEFEITNDTCCF